MNEIFRILITATEGCVIGFYLGAWVSRRAGPCGDDDILAPALAAGFAAAAILVSLAKAGT